MPKSQAKDGLGKYFHGELIAAGDTKYDAARRVWNGMIDRHPSLIARCADEEDVLRAIDFARDRNMLVAVRGGAHNVAGFGTCDDGMVIDCSPMKAVSLDAGAQTARAQAGLTWAEFDAATQAHGLATTGGLVSETGIAGFTLGGGIGWLMRKHGLTIDDVLEVELATADGRRVTANAEQNSDLFWGVRGGGGNFGVVTSFKYRVHHVGPEVFGGALFYPIAQARDILRFFGEWTSGMPDELTCMTAFLTAPPAPYIPQRYQGTPMIAVALCYIGSVDRGDALIKPLRDYMAPAVDLAGPIPYVKLQGMFDATAPRGILSYWKTEYLAGLSEQTIEALVSHAERMGSPYAQVHIHHVEGAVGRASSTATAFGHRDAPYILNIVGMWKNSSDTPAYIAWARNFSQAVQPFSTGSPYLNFLGDEGEHRVKAAYGQKKFDRLVELKRKYDPDNFFRLNQNIRPTA